MGQRPARLASVFLRVFLLSIAALFELAGCDRSADIIAPPATQPGHTVASLSPAATEILIGLGLGDRLVAVSNFDPPRDAMKNLPRVGDYQTTDWERLATLRPAVMITQFGPNRTPPGLVQKAADLHMRLVNVSITRLADIYEAMATLSAAVDQADRGRAAVEVLKQRLDAVAIRSTGRRVKTLIVLDDAGKGVAGRANYLDDLLQIAGGENAMAPGAPYPTIDREILLKLDPEVIFQLLPDATPQVQAAAARVWESLPQLRAVRDGRVHVITHPWSLNPTPHVAELADMFSAALAEARMGRPPATTTSSLTRTSP